VHGDVKPSNILLVGGVAKLADFSSAKLVARSPGPPSAFTPGYTTPEQVDESLRRRVAELGLEDRVDVYQLGSTLLHLATGEPLDGREASREEVERRTGRLDRRLAALLREMLAPDPARRPSAEDVSRKACALLKASSVR